MSVALPAIPRQAEISQRLLDFGAILTPPLGGAQQRIGRLGSRFAVDVRLPPLADSCARAMIAALLKAQAEATTLTLSWPQPAAAALGTTLVKGGGQAGTSLIVDGFSPSGVTIPALTFFSFVMGGRHYLHATTAAATAVGGEATLPIAPMLRVSPTDNLAVNMVTPTVEGFLDDGTVGWSLAWLKHRATAFTLTENE